MFVILTPVRTYATQARAIKAVEQRLDEKTLQSVTWFIHTHIDGRFFPVFVGERAVQAGVHFHFNVVA